MYFIINGIPKPLKRHRHTRHGRTYDPSKKDKQDLLYQVMRYAPKQPFTAPLRIIIVFYMPRPKANYRSGKFKDLLKPNQPIQHSKTPDLDNLEKLVCDALEGMFYKNDSQIAQKQSEKIYCSPGEEARTEICLTIINNDDKE